MDLTGQVAVVTGAGRGIGRAIAVGYARAGAAVCCAGRTLVDIESAVTEIRDNGGDAIAIQVDITENESVTNLFDAAAARLGGIDIAVLNAGGDGPQQTVEESDPQLWRACVELNLFGTYNSARAAIPHLRRRGGGKIITLGSGLGHRGRAGNSAYACAKAGVWMLTRVLGQELWRDGISVNELIPGPVQTDLDPTAVEDTTTRLGESEWVKAPAAVVPLALFLAGQPNPGPTAQSFSLMRRDT